MIGHFIIDLLKPGLELEDSVSSLLTPNEPGVCLASHTTWSPALFELFRNPPPATVGGVSKGLLIQAHVVVKVCANTAQASVASIPGDPTMVIPRDGYPK